jgi:DNA-binding HxlR family transcriptional regulator
MSDSRGVAEDECLAVWCAGDDWCGVTCAMDILDRKWHPVIVHRLLKHDALRFNELSAELGSITNKTLSNSLDDLEEKGLVDRTIEQEKPVRVSYALTEYGESLAPVIEALEEWGETYVEAADSEATADC